MAGEIRSRVLQVDAIAIVIAITLAYSTNLLQLNSCKEKLTMTGLLRTSYSRQMTKYHNGP